MDRETEMYHAAIKILSNRAEQYEYSDYLMHASQAELDANKRRMMKRVEDERRARSKPELEKRKNAMLENSKWERHQRNSNFMGDAELQSELGKHGYVNSTQGKISKSKSGNYTNVDNDEKRKVLDAAKEAIDYTSKHYIYDGEKTRYSRDERREIAKWQIELELGRQFGDGGPGGSVRPINKILMDRYKKEINDLVDKNITH